MTDDKNAEQDADKNPRPGKKHLGRNIFIGVLVLLAILVTTIFVAPKYVVRHLIADDLDRLGISHAGVETLQINLWKQEASIGPFKFHRGETKSGAVARVGTSLDLWGLFSREIVLTNVFIDGIDLDIVRSKNGRITINGVTPAEFVTDTAEEAVPGAESERWNARLEKFELRNSRALIRQEGAGELEVNIQKLTLTDFDTSDKEEFGTFGIDGRVNGIGFMGKGTARLFSPDIAIKFDSAINNAALAKIERYTGPLSFIKGGGSLDASMNHNVVLRERGSIDYSGSGTVSLKKADLTFPDAGKGTVESAAIKYSGKASIGADQTIRSANIDLASDVSDIRFITNGEDTTSLSAKTIKLKTAATIKQAANSGWQIDGNGSVEGETLWVRTPDGVGIEAASLGYKTGAVQMMIANDGLRGIAEHDRYTASDLQLAKDDLRVTIGKVEIAVGKDSFTGTSSRMENVVLSMGPIEAKTEVTDLAVGSVKTDLKRLSIVDFGPDAAIGAAGNFEISEIRTSGEWPADSKFGATGKLDNLKIEIADLKSGSAKETPVTFSGNISLGGLAAEIDKGKTVNLSLGSLNSRGISFSGTEIAVQEIALDQLTADISQKLFATLFPGNPKDTETKATLNFKIGTFSLTSPAKLRYRDPSVTPAASTDLLIEQLSLKDVSSADPGKQSDIRLKSKINGFSELNLVGSGSLFSTNGDGQAKGSLKNLQISRFSPYTRPLLGLHIDSGQLTAEFDGKMSGGKLDSDLDLKIDRLKFGKLSAAETRQIKDKIGVPIETAVSLLRDSNNVINLKVPVGGTLTDPSFDLSGAVGKAVGGLLKSVFPPTLLLGIVQSAGKGLSGDSVAIVPFSAGEASLGPAADEAVEKLVDLMKRRPDLRLRVCGVATPADRAALPASAAAAKPAAGATSPADQEKAMINRLTALALARTVSVRKKLSGFGKAVSDRVAECRARWSPADKAGPRAEVKF